ncbi:Uma2 family endonuclease [Microcoleus sp. FACHB-1515]|uniref:Uma2 family endonuclease n=1 Tax=Cyanophyceae TaxID=3028117 RepID=UPI0016875412|nr:Uma2 family endonuclease [Microcoleus sp. FACHB-1515]MBD2090291.1 Uma2 family endonuclease [Microcoleus sp. FACHB-1515]
MTAIVLNLKPLIELNDDQFEQLCRNHHDLSFERTAKGELVIVPLVGGIDGIREAELISRLVLWNRQTRSGIVFSSSAGFRLPNGAIRSPDAAWVSIDRWENLTPDEQKKFAPLCPDFAIELRSETDEITDLQQKMQEYLDNGLRLGWLINPQDQQVEIYRVGQLKEVCDRPSELNGEDVLPGFVLGLAMIWES